MSHGDLIRKNISENIVKYRLKAGLSQKELATLLHTTPSRVSNWEQGANCPSADIIFDLCKALHVSVNDIYGLYPESNEVLTYGEKEHIQKYRTLDEHGKDLVDTVLDKEQKRSPDNAIIVTRDSDPDQTELLAARPETTEPHTDDEREHDIQYVKSRRSKE